MLMAAAGRSKRDVAMSLVRQARRRAVTRDIPFDLHVEDFDVPDFCPVLGIPLYRAVGCKAQGANSPTLDRIVPELGYVRGNVRVISARANQIKSDATPEELLRVACYCQENT